MKVLTIGGATQDIFLNYAGADFMTITKQKMTTNYMLFQSGEKVEIDEIIYLTGGGSTNSATSFKRLGLKASCFCAIGNDPAGKAVLDDLEQEGVNTTHISTSTSHHTGTSFIINSLQKDRTIFAHRGANGFLELEKVPFDEIKISNQLYITSLSSESAKLLPEILTFAHQNNIPVAINPGASQLIKGTVILKQSLENIDTLILNCSEAKTFMMALIESNKSYKKTLISNPEQKTSVVTMSDEHPYLIDNPIPYENLYFNIRNFFKEVLKMGPKIVVITNGRNGVYVATNEFIFFHPSMKVNVMNTVGAGDAFGSCFVGSLMLGLSIQEALRNGIVNSASVLENIGAKRGLLTRDQINEKIKTLDPSLLQQFTL